MSENKANEDLVRVASEDDITNGDRVIVEVQGREVAVFQVDDEYYGYLNYCPHQGGPICKGKISGTLQEEDGELIYDNENEILSCPWHAWEFDLKDGKALANPQYRLPQHQLQVEDGEIYIKL